MDMKIVQTFGERLKTLREAAEVSQFELAAQSGVPIGTIRDYEQQRRGPLLETAVKLARALGKPLEAFLPSEGEDAAEVKTKAERRIKRK